MSAGQSLILIGGGGHCLSCIAAIETTEKLKPAERFRVHGIVDNERNKRGELREIAGYPLLGGDERLPEVLHECGSVLITIGFIESPLPRIRLYEWLSELEPRVNFPTVIAGNAAVARGVEVGPGSIIMQYGIVNTGARVGPNCIVNNRTLIEHGAQIGDHSHIATGAIVNGDCQLGKRVFMGSGAVLKNGIRIADDVRIGAGAVVVNDLLEPGWYAGNPARFLRKI
jgi:sugar O-acyltransferase (sialic acid O-acetyltransferase NeuD family)